MLLEIFGFMKMSLVDILDILVVAFCIFLVFKWIKDSSAINVFFGILLLILLRIVAVALNMKLFSSLMGTILDVGVIALIVIFQPEIRRFLFKFGSNSRLTQKENTFIRKFLGIKTEEIDRESVREIAEACKEMSDQKTGALIVLRRKNALSPIIETGDTIDAMISKRLIMNIFFKNSPLHDGAMVISNGRILAARCTLPITERTNIPARYGMRHKAAIGLTEQFDADVIVVSEETGSISFVHAGQVETVKSINRLKTLMGIQGEDNQEETQA